MRHSRILPLALVLDELKKGIARPCKSGQRTEQNNDNKKSLSVAHGFSIDCGFNRVEMNWMRTNRPIRSKG